MKLTPIERWFTHAMTTAYPELVERRLETQSRVMISRRITQRNRFVVLLINLARYVGLVLELLTSRFRAASQTEATLFWELIPTEVAGRIPFLERNVPHTQFKGLSYRDTIVSLPQGFHTGRIMGVLLGTILASVLYTPSELTPNLIRIVRTSLLTFSHVYQTRAKAIYLFEIYRVETPFVAAFLKEMGICVHLVAASAPLSFDNRILIGDSLKACDPYQVDEFEHYRPMGICQTCDLWLPETIHRLEAHYRHVTLRNNCNVIGVYTSGILLRARMGVIYEDFAARAIRREMALLEIVAAYAKSHPDVQFIIFPHPMERRHYKATGVSPFGQEFRAHNIDIDYSEADDSTLQFDRVGLGVTNFSSIGFERIYLGLRTIFYIGDLEYINWDIRSPYHSLFFTDMVRFSEAIEKVRHMSHQEFMTHYFGRRFYTGLRFE